MKDTLIICWEVLKVLAGLVCLIAKLLFGAWMITFVSICGAIGFIVAFGFTVGFFAIMLEVIRLYH